VRVSLRVEYLSGAVQAANSANRTEPEWPPHPMRLFSALVAAYFQHDGSQDERTLLECLESLPAPALTYTDAVTRNTGVAYVPVNDDDRNMQFAQHKGSQKQGTAEITPNPPIGRGWRFNRFRSGRTFPVATPVEPVVYFHWDDAHLHSQRETLQRLAARVPYLGRSSSVVQISVVDQAPLPTIQPCEYTSDMSLRVPYPGILRRMEQCYELAMQSDTGLRAHRPATSMQAYDRCDAGTGQQHSVFGECFVFQRLEGPRVPLEASLHLTSTARLTLLSLADNPRIEILSGHREDGRPSAREHVAIVPLANVGYPHSDGDIKGLGIVLPKGTSRDERREVLVALSRLQELRLGRRGVWRVDRVLASPLWSLNWQRYSRPALIWATVTPMVFAKHPRPSRPADEVVAAACRQVGLPEPISVEVGPQASFVGSPDARSCGTVSTAGKPILPPSRRGARVSQLDQRGNPARFRSHVRVTFAEPVVGPVILGAGQYLGMGLLAPCGRFGALQDQTPAREP
jgi:CRISPR-associated protein Csb2